jgi:hypothetical protein
MIYAIPPSDSRPDKRASKQAMRRNNDQIFITDATVTKVAAVLDLVIAKTSDDLEFHLSLRYLIIVLEASGFTCGGRLKRR